MSDCLRPQGLQHARLPCPSLSPRVYLNLMSVESMMPSNHLILCCSLLLLSSDFPSIRVFSNNWLFISDGLSIRASVSASVLPMNIQCRFPLELTGLISLHPRDSQGSSPAPQFERFNSLEFSLLYGPTLTFICDYWKNHSFDSSDVSAF